MRGRSALFDSTDVQDGVFEVHLLPAQVHQLRGPQTVPEGHKSPVLSMATRNKIIRTIIEKKIEIAIFDPLAAMR
jgi:hypothetical protein